ncbi:MAG: hypothetical protein AVO35_10625 [Candidatus Aegiribacteria sp. MLS_C]|nr:MAG: hypothetical protein AVO35_10625 [Candidatus Aegiribacteria sp. MLS_C]
MTPERNEERKVLAIAIMRDGKVVGKLIPGREPVRMGIGYNNNIVVEGSGLPDSMVLITQGEDSETWLLRMAESMDAVIESIDGTTLKFSDLRDLGIFPMDPDGFYMLNVKYLDQGQIMAGPFVIHFGFIAPPMVSKPPEKKERKQKPEKAAAETGEKRDDRVLKIVVESPDGKQELVPNAGLMTVGEAEYNTVTAKGIGLPRIHTLLEPQGSKYIMRLIPGIKGGVEVKGSVIPFHTLIERNLMQQEKPGEPYVWVFDRGVNGVFTLGDKEIFFSFIEPDAVPGRKDEKEKAVPEIPRKKYVAPEYDWENFATRPHEAIAMKGQREESGRIAIILGLGLAVALLTGAVFDRFVTVVNETKEQKLRAAPTARVATLASSNRQTQGIGEEIITDMSIGEETVAVGEGGGGPAGSGGGTEGGTSDGAAAGQAVLQSIGFAAYGTGGTGGSAGIATDLQAAASSGAGLVSGGGGEAVVAGASGGGSGGISGLIGEGGGPSASIEGVSSSEVEAVHRAAEVSFSAHSSSSQIGVQGRTMSDIRRKTNMIITRIKRAYEDLLRSNPTAGGTINVSFSITPSGSVSGVSVSAGGSLGSLEPSVRAAVQSLNFGPSSEQTDNIPMTVPINLVPPE